MNSSVSTTPVRGMRDFLPSDKEKRERVLQVIRKSFVKHGFVEIETPYLEALTHLMSDQGGDNEKMVFKVQRRGLAAADVDAVSSPDDLCDLGLRYDLTLPLARYYANNRGKIPEVFRCLQIGSVWRAERPQKGRYRQFTQCDIDIIGEPGLFAEVELITTTVRALKGVGLHDLTLRLNDRRLLMALLRDVAVPDESGQRCLVAIDKLDKIGLEGVVGELRAILDAGVVRRLAAALTALIEPGFGLAQFSELVDQPEVPGLTSALSDILDGVSAGVADSGVALRFDGSLVRGMGYYSGPIFELWHPSFRGAISGGGRYDGMVGRFLGRDVEACGFSIGFERILDLVSLPPEDREAGIAILYEEGVDWGLLVRLQGDWIERGLRARLVRRPKRIGPLLDALVEEGFESWLEVSQQRGVGDVRDLAKNR